MTDIQNLDGPHRHWAHLDRDTLRPEGRPDTGGSQKHKIEEPTYTASGPGVLQAEIMQTLAAIEVPAKEEVAKSVAWVSARIGDEAGAGLVAQANLQPARALALLGS